MLKTKGYKFTDSRELIVKFFLNNSDKHFSPQDVYSYLKKMDESIGIATVYRNIKLLMENEIIEEVICKNKKVYELKLFGKKSVHAHFTCRICNKIIDYNAISSSLKILGLINQIEKEYDFNIEDVDILFSGICKDCLNEEEEKDLL